MWAILNFLHSIAIVTGAIGLVLLILTFIAPDINNSYVAWIASWFMAISYLFDYFYIFISPRHNKVTPITEGMDLFFFVWYVFFIWKNRHNRKKKKKLTEIVGEKTKSIIRKMTSKLTPSPIPQPTGR